MSVDVAVVGAGLFGSVIAAALRKGRASVLVIDDARPEAGSKPAACLMKPGWFSGLGKNVYDPALTLLDSLYGLRDVQFSVLGAKRVKVHWCDPAAILKPPDVRGFVQRIENTKGGHRLFVEGKETVSARKVVVAAGIWTPQLVCVTVPVEAYSGEAYLWPKRKIDTPFIRPWAPYKQVVAFNRGDGLWVGDGSTIKNWNDARASASLSRCAEAVGMKEKPQRLFGHRPFTRRTPCYLEELRSGLWVATGGAKNGTILAGWCASELVDRLA